MFKSNSKLTIFRLAANENKFSVSIFSLYLKSIIFLRELFRVYLTRPICLKYGTGCLFKVSSKYLMQNYRNI